jgi:hypothetical protein
MHNNFTPLLRTLLHFGEVIERNEANKFFYRPDSEAILAVGPAHVNVANTLSALRR